MSKFNISFSAAKHISSYMSREACTFAFTLSVVAARITIIVITIHAWITHMHIHIHPQHSVFIWLSPFVHFSASFTVASGQMCVAYTLAQR